MQYSTTCLSGVAEEESLVDEGLEAHPVAQDVPVAVRVLPVDLPRLRHVVGERGEPPEHRPRQQLHDLGQDGDVVDDLRVGGHGADGEPRVEHVGGVGEYLAQEGEDGAGEGVHFHLDSVQQSHFMLPFQMPTSSKCLVDITLLVENNLLLQIATLISTTRQNDWN